MNSELSKFFISSGCKILCGDEEKIIVKNQSMKNVQGVGIELKIWILIISVRCNSNMTGEGEIRSFFN